MDLPLMSSLINGYGGVTTSRHFNLQVWARMVKPSKVELATHAMILLIFSHADIALTSIRV